MNIINILALADHLETLPNKPQRRGEVTGFDMSRYFRFSEHEASGVVPSRDKLSEHCGTTACMAGHAALLGEAPAGRNTFVFAKRWLGIEPKISYSLFAVRSPLPGGVNVHDITPIHAARCLRHLAATGEVDWKAAVGAAS